jgi:hypothetical protein
MRQLLRGIPKRCVPTHPTNWRLADFVGGQVFEVFVLAVKDTAVRTHEFVAGNTMPKRRNWLFQSDCPTILYIAAPIFLIC